MLNNTKKIVKKLATKLPKVNIASSGLIPRKDRKKLDKKCYYNDRKTKESLSSKRYWVYR